MYFDRKRGKLIVKDNPVTLRDSQPTKKVEKKIEEEFEAPIDKNKFLKKKRVQNVQRDRDEQGESDDEQERRGKKSYQNNEGKVKRKETHIVKFSGDEYKNKSGKGDKLVSGKYEPFAYIQLNPKTTSHKRRDDTVKLFEGIMHPQKKSNK